MSASIAACQTESKTACLPALQHLEKLVSFDTQNPPRTITCESDIFTYLKNHLRGFNITLEDSGEGCISLLAVRGKPDLLFNFHIDTVPKTQNWSSDPFKLKIDDNKATGLGACDIKGAAGCMLSAVNQTQGGVALLFTSDEEHGSSKAVKQFLTSEHGFKQVIIAEPTEAKAVLAHRGIQSAKAIFKGVSGHASEARALKDSAIHRAAHWMTSSLQWVEQQTASFDSLCGLPFNVGKIDGGIKANMIAADCELAFGFRPLPGQDAKQMLAQLEELACESPDLKQSDIEILPGFIGPTLPAANQDFDKAILAATSLAESLQLNIGSAVNFWTEASLFSQSGMTAIVFGPGNIAQAHTADEWVCLNQLAKVENHYIQIIESKTAGTKQ